MFHLPIHLIDEIKRGGPVSDWWMYPIERYLNASVKKQSKRFNKSQEKSNEIDEESPLFPNAGYPLGRKKKGKKKGKSYTLDSNTMTLTHRYVLFNCEDDLVENYIKEHEEFVKKKPRDRRKRRWKEAQEHSNEFKVWFRGKVEVNNVLDHIKWLTKGPSSVAQSYIGYFCNRYKFYTRDHDEKCKTQNSGVSLTALIPSFASSKDHNPVLGDVTYYGIIRNRALKYDPFVLASQVHQVFYTQDGLEEDWYYVNRNLPRDNFYVEGQFEQTFMSEVREPAEDVIFAIGHVEHHNWCREAAYDRVEVPVNNEIIEKKVLI
uniref:DUF4218 domain-containing protein n=1 Tax=Chenopodium quinoa TaxID=63459 RepID=A0A803MP21_CHEQI